MAYEDQNVTQETEQIIAEARDLLKDADVWQVLLFGSRVVGTERDDSDVDLIVITDRGEPFRSFSERSAVLIDLRSRLSTISSRYGLDLLVFTRAEWISFLDRRSSFSKEIQSTAVNVA